VPAALMTSTTRAALAFGAAPAGAAAAATATTLAEEMLNAMTLSKLKLTTVVLLAVALLAGGAALVGQAPLAQAPAAKAATIPPRPAAEGGKPARTDLYGDPLPRGALARLGTVRLRHPHFSSASFMAFLADGKQVLSAANDGTARLWDTASGKEVRRFGRPRPPQPYSYSLGMRAALSADGKTLATCDGDEVIRLWEVATGKEAGRLKGIKVVKGTKGGATALALSRDGKAVAAAAPDGQVHVWDRATGKELRRFNEPKAKAETPAANDIFGAVPLAFAPDGKTLITPARGGEGFIVWDVASGKETRRIQIQAGLKEPAFICGPSFTPDGKALAWSDNQGAVHLWDPKTGKELRRLESKAEGTTVLPSSFAFSAAGKTLVTRESSNGGVIVWDVASSKERRRVGKLPAAGTWWGSAMAVSPDGKVLASPGDESRGAGNRVVLRDLTTGMEVPALGGTRR
jgi:WD40 repeat protein